MDLQEYYSRFIVILSDTPERGWLHDTNWLNRMARKVNEKNFPYSPVHTLWFQLEDMFQLILTPQGI